MLGHGARALSLSATAVTTLRPASPFSLSLSLLPSPSSLRSFLRPSLCPSLSSFFSSSSHTLFSHRPHAHHPPNAAHPSTHTAVRLHYVSEERHHSAHPPLILLHGLLGSANNYRSLLPRLANTLDRSVYALDLRNHGSSPHVASMEYAEMAADLQLFLRERGMHSAVVVGHSLGGKVAMAFAMTHPSLLERLVVVDVSPRPYFRLDDSVGEVDAVVRAVHQMPVNEIATREQANRWLSAHIPNPSVRNFALTNFLPGSPSAWRIHIDAIQRFMPRLRETPLPTTAVYKGPTLFIVGTRSGFVNPDRDRDVILAHFPHVDFARIDAGHWVHHEKPTEFVQAIAHFLAAPLAAAGL